MSKQLYTKAEKKVAKLFDLPMPLTSLLLIPVFVVPLLYIPSPEVTFVLAVLNVLVWLVIYLELAVKFSVSSNWRRTIVDNWLLCIIAIAPSLVIFRSLLLLRFASLLRLFRLQSIVDRLGRQMKRLIVKVEYFLAATIIFILGSAFLIWHIEVSREGAINSFSEALWWSVITVTTVGYGDVVPATDIGKVVGAFVAIVGSILFTVFVTRITIFFINGK